MAAPLLLEQNTLCCAALLCCPRTVLLQMGLGKTAQSISVLAFQKQYGGCRGPFLGEARQQHSRAELTAGSGAQQLTGLGVWPSPLLQKCISTNPDLPPRSAAAPLPPSPRPLCSDCAAHNPGPLAA